MKSLFVPKEMVGVFLSTSKSVKEWSDPSFLQGILSPLDVAFYIMANVRAHELLGSDLTQSFPNEIVTDVGADVFRGLSREIDIELQKQASTDKLDTNGMVPAIVYFDGTHVFFTLADPIDGVNPVDAIIAIVADSLPFEVLAKLPVFTTYLTERQKVFQ